MILFINACAREGSRTLTLAKKSAQKLSGRYEMLELFKEGLMPLDGKDISRRETLIQNGDLSDDMFRFAKQFREADEIIIAAPYWDLSFPAVLKCYIEAICVNGLTFCYDENGIPHGNCKAKRLIYVTTAGGYIPENNFGYDYIKKLCDDFFGIKDTVYIKAQGLDIVGADVDSIIEKAIESI